MGLLEPANNQELLSHQADGGERRGVEDAIRLTDGPLESNSSQPAKPHLCRRQNHEIHETHEKRGDGA